MYDHNDTDRGQLILIGALVLSISLVLLVTILNSVLFAGNLASDNPSPEADNPEEIDRFAHDELAPAIITANDAEAVAGLLTNNPPTARQQLQTIAKMQFRRQAGSSAEMVDYTLSSTSEDGVMVRQTVDGGTRNFTSPTNSNDWTLLENADDVRRFQIAGNAGANELYEADPGTVSYDTLEQNAFHVRVTSYPAEIDNRSSSDTSYSNEVVPANVFVTGSGSDLSATDTTITGAVSADGQISFDDGSETGGSVYGGNQVDIDQSEINGSVGAEGDLTMTDTVVRGDVISTGDIDLDNTTVKGDVIGTGDISVGSGSTVNGEVKKVDSANPERVQSEWRVYVFADSSNTAYVATAQGGKLQTVAEAGSGNFTIGIVTGEVNNRSEAIAFNLPTRNEYDVEYQNGDKMSGEYVVVGKNAIIQNSDLTTDASGDDPYYESDVVYSATINITYQTADYTYSEKYTVKPCGVGYDACPPVGGPANTEKN